MEFLIRRWLSIGVLLLVVVDIVFIWISWGSKNDFLINSGFLLLGALLAIATSLISDANQRKTRVNDLAHALHCELADLVARCCFDAEAPWQQYWKGTAPEKAFNVIRLRKFL